MGKQGILCPKGEDYLSSRAFEKKQQTGRHRSGEKRVVCANETHAWELDHEARRLWKRQLREAAFCSPGAEFQLNVMGSLRGIKSGKWHGNICDFKNYLMPPQWETVWRYQ